MPDDPSCSVCFSPASGCVCPECPTCGDTGNSRCYKDHVLKLNRWQLVIRTEKRIADLEEEVDVERQYLEHLNSLPDGYCEDWSEV